MRAGSAPSLIWIQNADSSSKQKKWKINPAQTISALFRKSKNSRPRAEKPEKAGSNQDQIYLQH